VPVGVESVDLGGRGRFYLVRMLQLSLVNMDMRVAYGRYCEEMKDYDDYASCHTQLRSQRRSYRGSPP
jgi:hypothetical protein